MSTPYIEKYEIPGHTFQGIEDHKTEVKQKGKFPFDYTAPRKRYQAWSGGCGIGDRSTLPEIRMVIYCWAVESLRAKRDKLRRELRYVEQSIQKLQPDGTDPEPFNLGQFKVDLFDHEKPKRERA